MWQITVLSVLVPVAVYGLARVVFTAYFRAKTDFIRRLTHGNDPSETNDQ